MEYWVQIIASFILGGGILTVFTVRSNRKAIKVDAYGKMEQFWQASNESIRKEFTIRVLELEKRITELEKTVCRRTGCKSRLK